MQALEVVIIGIGLAMDAFAVSICKGLQMRKMNYKLAAIIACFFGGFQALMPLIGWMLGRQFQKYIVAIDHWIAFFLLAAIGCNMIKESREKEEQNGDVLEHLNYKEMVLLSLATSIDALAVGITFAFLKVHISSAITIIGVLTFFISFVGVSIGNVFGTKYKSKAELFGGVVLIFMGIKILFEHLGILML